MRKVKVITSKIVQLAAAGVLLVAAPSAFALSTWGFNQTNVTNIAGVGASGDPVVSLTGVYAVNGTDNLGFAANATWSSAALSYFSGGGQGMYTGLDSSTVGTGGQKGVPFHALDNNVNTEAVLLNFGTQSVSLSNISLGWVSDNVGTSTNGDSVDISLFRWVGGNNLTPTGSPSSTGSPRPLVGQGAALMTGWQLVGNYGDMVLDKNAPYSVVNSSGLGSSWWLISAYNSGYSNAGETRGSLDVGNDYFKLYAVTGAMCTSTAANVCSPNKVPEPGSIALLGLGLVGMAAARRRKQASQ